MVLRAFVVVVLVAVVFVVGMVVGMVVVMVVGAMVLDQSVLYVPVAVTEGFVAFRPEPAVENSLRHHFPFFYSKKC